MHKEAVQDYEEALKLDPEDSGLLNNLAWVLATSPDDEVRDGSRSIDLATKACEVTEYKLPHILSTLAAGHAEAGDFDKAIEWSTKAVAMEAPNQTEQVDDQLERELKSYREKKPWRERQNVEEKDDDELTLDDADLDSLEDLKKDADESNDDADSDDAAEDSANEEAEDTADGTDEAVEESPKDD
jgi:Tfp pilus assembly protein PilF